MKKLCFVFGIILGVGILPAHAELPSKMRENLSDIVKEYCHSTISYSIDDSLGTWEEDAWSEKGKASEFHTTIGCIFDSALQELTEGAKADGVQSKSFGSAGGKDISMQTFTPKGNCQPQYLSIVQGEQEAKDFVSQCKSDIPEISQEFSSCRVAETILQEWCGYDLFLYAKAQDEKSFYEQQSFVSREMMLARFRAERNRIQKERTQTQEAIMDSLEWYQATESATRQSVWIIALTEDLSAIQKEWGQLRSALGTFVDKFLNAGLPSE